GYYKGNLTTKYDKQQEIYTDLLKEVDEATAALDPTADRVTGDVICNGDIEKWKRFGNSLLLRLDMRLTKVDEATAKAYATKAAGNTMSRNDDNDYLNDDVSGARVSQDRSSQVVLGYGGQENYDTK